MQKLLLALAFGTLLSELRLGAEGRNPPYGVKLCGREFIRAVIFTCDLDILSGPPAEEDSAEAASSEWDASRLPATLPHQDLSSDYHERWRGKPGRGLAEESWPLERTVRDVMAGLSTSCCKWGCSKSEISSLC
ncbi:H(+)/Cl(-) exchange transporter 5 [Platysternon megacephalum]|uniref:H(+)/Cl(-) exchange transporter 5 n=1 Tax=Platysternon megacephalum TaxID=55544 RepID=A0A4D9E2Q1_9SAUR|nr:H(+)/Cl(-) exchange transporter 5 [Platysternon megacephalum]